MKKINWVKILSYLKAIWPYIKILFVKNLYARMLSQYIGTVIIICTGWSVHASGLLSDNPNVDVSYGEIALEDLYLVGIITFAYFVTLCFIYRSEYNSIYGKIYDEYMAKLFKDMMAPIQTIRDFIGTFDNHVAFINGGSNLIDSVIEKLKDPKQSIYIKAFSGMGKTRWVFEAFKECDEDNVFYCREVETDIFKISFGKLLVQYSNKEATLILDDCPMDVFRYCLDSISRSNSSMRLIALSNDMNNSERVNVPIIEFGYNDLKDVTEAIVESLLDERLKDRYKLELVRLAESIPYMAILLVEDINKHANDNHIDALNIRPTDFCDRMLHFDEPNKEEKITAFESISLFSPLGYRDYDKWQLDFVKNSNNITEIISNVNRDILFDNVIRSAKKQQILENISTWINVRPAPLATWLIDRWFSCCDEDRLIRVLNEITSLPERQGNALIEALSKRIESMGENTYANKLYSNIVKPGRAFFSEEVVKTEIGSRLFLAMCNVNPTAIAECLLAIFESKDIEWLKTQICYRVRRNYVWLLEKACFPEASFMPAALAMARLALAENETWGNNATNQFGQLFHVGLAGTSVDLKARLSLIEEIAERGDEYEPLVYMILDKVFDYGSFCRTGGAEKIGGKFFKDFSPSGIDIVDYWNNVTSFIEGWIGDDAERCDRIADIFVSHVRQIGWQAGCIDIVKRQIKIITSKRDGQWPEMAKELRFGLNHHAKFEDKELIAILHSIEDKSFVGLLVKTQDNFHTHPISMSEDSYNKNESYFKECTDRFWNDKEYENDKTMDYLLDNNNYIDIWFIRALFKDVEDKQIEAYFVNAINKMKKNGWDMSSFINISFNVVWQRDVTKSIVNRVPVEGMDFVYVQVMSDHENESLFVLKDILNRYHGDKRIMTLLDFYLKRSALYSSKQMKDTCNLISEQLSGNSDLLLFDYIIQRRYSDFIFEAAMIDITKRLTLLFVKNENDAIDNYELFCLIADILEKYDDADYVKELNNSIIGIAEKRYDKREYDLIYSKMLPKYEGIVLTDILDAIRDEGSAFWLEIMNKIGSGFSENKDNAILFRCNNDTIKDYCLKNAKTKFPERIAHMIPVYDFTNGEHFSNFLKWMLDHLHKFSSGEAVLSAIHSNINSFSWVGSPIILYERQKACFLEIKNHKNSLVADWANRSLAEIENNIRLQERTESYEKIKYQ